MSSPFATLEEFNGAIDGPTEGAIYTFAGSPIINNIALLVAVGLFVWFIIRTYNTHADLPSIDKSLNHLSTFIVVGLLSFVAADSLQPNQGDRATQTARHSRLTQAARRVPVGLLGLASIGFPSFRRSSARKRKYSSRSLRDYRSKR